MRQSHGKTTRQSASYRGIHEDQEGLIASANLDKQSTNRLACLVEYDVKKLRTIGSSELNQTNLVAYSNDVPFGFYPSSSANVVTTIEAHLVIMKRLLVVPTPGLSSPSQTTSSIVVIVNVVVFIEKDKDCSVYVAVKIVCDLRSLMAI